MSVILAKGNEMKTYLPPTVHGLVTHAVTIAFMAATVIAIANNLAPEKQ